MKDEKKCFTEVSLLSAMLLCFAENFLGYEVVR